MQFERMVPGKIGSLIYEVNAVAQFTMSHPVMLPNASDIVIATCDICQHSVAQSHQEFKKAMDGIPVWFRGRICGRVFDVNSDDKRVSARIYIAKLPKNEDLIANIRLGIYREIYICMDATSVYGIIITSRIGDLAWRNQG